MYVPDHYANLAAELAEHMEVQGGGTKASAGT
jgi:hypothetical protein